MASTAIKQELVAASLGWKLCCAGHDIGLIYCHGCISLFAMPDKNKEGVKRLAADVAQRLGFNWKFATRGYVLKARQETKRALKHGKTARREGTEMMKELDDFFARRDLTLLSVYALTYPARMKKYARWDFKPTIAGGSNATPYFWTTWRWTPMVRWGAKKFNEGYDQDPGTTSWGFSQASSWWTSANHSAGGGHALLQQMGVEYFLLVVLYITLDCLVHVIVSCFVPSAKYADAL